MALFASRCDTVYKPQPPFHDADYAKCFKSLLSNLLGGIGYFYGDSKVDTSHAPEYEEKTLDFWRTTAEARTRHSPETVPPTELFSFVPSRPFFPRGFLWDDGFHLLVAMEWDLDLALEILMSWFALMDEDGWIAREQILGPEARRKVPPEFQVQYPHYANPPTMFLVVTAFVDILMSKTTYHGHSSHYLEQPELATEFLERAYPLMKRHYGWFRRTQSGDLTGYTRPSFASEEGYRWRGRTSQHTLTSGLDDYPRAQPPHPGELHLDALSWVGSMAGALGKVTRYLSRPEDEAAHLKQRLDIVGNVESLHWSASDQAYCDATIEHGAHAFVCHKGYISLFPFMLGLMVPNNPHLGAVLDLIRDENELWSPHGLRSLSRKDSLYGTEENYWRSPIWVNINYLVLQQLLVSAFTGVANPLGPSHTGLSFTKLIVLLQELAQVPGPFQDKARHTYNELRRNIVTTVYKTWRATGFAWEQYNPDTGAGQRTQHFTGWTALTVKVMAMPELELRPATSDPELPRSQQWSRSLIIGTALLSVVILIFRRRVSRLFTSLGSR